MGKVVAEKPLPARPDVTRLFFNFHLSSSFSAGKKETEIRVLSDTVPDSRDFDDINTPTVNPNRQRAVPLPSHRSLQTDSKEHFIFTVVTEN